MARECEIDRNNGSVTIRLCVDNGVISGGDFAVYGFASGIVTETFKLHTNTSGQDVVILNQEPDLLLDQVLSWQVLSCSPIITDTAVVLVEVLQNGMSCAVNKPAKYSLRHIPNCALGQAIQLKGGLHFVTSFTPGS
jgi:hypothetical protein